MFNIGVLSDTHGYLDPQVAEVLADVDHVLHAGDVGPARVLAELEALAPVTAVLGNTDASVTLRDTELVELAGRKFLVHHIVNPRALREPFTSLIERARPDVVVFGHTHRRFCETIGGILFLNPGYAGAPKVGQERSVAILHCDARGIRPEFLVL